MKSITRISTALALCSLWIAVAAQGARYTVQIEALPSLDGAQEKVTKLKKQGVDAYIVKSQALKNGTFYRVRVGEFPNQAEARKVGMDLRKRGIVSEFFVAAYEPPQEDSNTPTTINAKMPEKIAPATSVKARSKTQNQPAISPRTSSPTQRLSNAIQGKIQGLGSTIANEQPAPKRSK